MQCLASEPRGRPQSVGTVNTLNGLTEPAACGITTDV